MANNATPNKNKTNPFDIPRGRRNFNRFATPAFFRSASMSLCQMLLHREVAFDCLYNLGMEGKVEFIVYEKDGYYKPCMSYVREVKLCNELLQIIKTLQTEIDNCHLSTLYYPNVDVEEIPKESDLQQIQAKLEEIQAELKDVLSERESLQLKHKLLTERLFVLKHAEELFTGASHRGPVLAWTNSSLMNVLHDGAKLSGSSGNRDNQAHLQFFTGTILVEKFYTFEQVCWRICHGNFYMRHAEIPQKVKGVPPKRASTAERKYAFVILYVGEALRRKIAKLCQAFTVQLHDYPKSTEERLANRKHVATELSDIELVLAQITEQHRRILSIATLHLCVWRAKVTKMLMIYNAMNKMAHVQQVDKHKYLVAECWIPTSYLAQTRQTLLQGALRSTEGLPTFPPIITEIKYKPRIREPPTYFEVNKFTRGFQHLIDAYGIAAYKELNPAPYTIVTFPFLFAVMFGDVGHGILMALLAAWMCVREKRLAEKQRNARSANDVYALIFDGRYIILLMGLFSIYTGLIYNDVFCKPLNLFGSHWRVNFTKSTVESMDHLEYLELDPYNRENYRGTPYVFGMDPIWEIADASSITTFNSLKMKTAIILGVLHMLFGLALSAWNSYNFRNPWDIYLVFLPQIVFMLCLFFYLVLMIFIKWSLFGGHYDAPYNAACAPSILIMFINMMLFKDSSKGVKKDCKEELFTFQMGLQSILIFFAFVSLPILLLGKPIRLHIEQKKIKAIEDAERKRTAKRETLNAVRRTLQAYNVEYMKSAASSSSHVVAAKTAEDEGKVDMTEVWIHQGILCIESVLGAVSHTASYLRLWALSLAHKQLSFVLWDLIMRFGLVLPMKFYGSIALFLVFWLWAILTVTILVVMEGLSAFLHTLRLHWVEFQSKFYAGSGVKFMPFYFQPTRKYL